MIPATKFCTIHNITPMSVYVHHTKGVCWTKKVGETLFVDDKYLEEVRNTRRRYWLSSHDYYYYFTYVLGIKQGTFAKQLSKMDGATYTNWNTFMQNYLFKVDERSITNTTIGKYLTNFLAACEEMIPKIHKKLRHDKEYQLRLKDME